MCVTNSTMRRESGFSLLESLIALIIITIGLLGLAALQGTAIQAEFESYQRAQALILMNDMVDRINANRDSAACYAITDDVVNGTSYLGTTGTGYMTPIDCATGFKDAAGKTLALADLAAWDDLLKGAGETKGGASVGAMIGARGCVSFNAVNSTYTVAVAWQGGTNTFAQTNPCAKNLYGNDRARRVVTTTLRLGNLSGT